MTEKEHFKRRYEEGDTPWEIDRPDYNLIRIVNDWSINPGKALDAGCGTGDNTIWLASHGFEATGCDSSRLAIDQALEKAAAAEVICEFITCDFLEDDIEEAPFSFLFDRGCFHTFSDPDKRLAFVSRAAGLLERGGLWLSLIGNSDEIRPEGQEGPPQLTASEIVNAVEPYFEILMLRSGHFDSNQEPPPRNWICLKQKRDNIPVS